MTAPTMAGAFAPHAAPYSGVDGADSARLSADGPALARGGPAHGRPAMAIPDFQIVPLRALPIVAAVFVALVAAIGANRTWPGRSSSCTWRLAPPGPSSTCSWVS